MRAPVAGEDPASQIFIGNALFVAGARPDVAAGFPLKPYFNRAGWGYLMLTNYLPNRGNGTFTLFAYADDVEGKSTLLGSKTITCTNASATLPFGAIDTPDQGATVSGTFINFGWVLAAQPTASGLFIPFDGSTITVFVDSVPIGTLKSFDGNEGFNNARPDIQTLFPGFANTDGAVGFKVIDTTAYANGTHTIVWSASDNTGATAGIGSRFFTIANNGSALRAGLTAAPSSSAHAAGAWVRVIRGFDATEIEDVPAGQLVQLSAPAMQLIRIELDPWSTGVSHRGAEIVEGETRPLPVGATLDERTGEFRWIPPVGFAGTHHLRFVRTRDGNEEEIRIDVIVR
jgi:hypothetical protein